MEVWFVSLEHMAECELTGEGKGGGGGGGGGGKGGMLNTQGANGTLSCLADTQYL